MEYQIPAKEAKTNKEYQQVVDYLQRIRGVSWKYRTVEKGQLNVILEGSFEGKRKKVVLEKVPEYILNLTKKDSTPPVADSKELKIEWGERNGKDCLFFCKGESVRQEEAMMLCTYFDRDRFDLISGQLNPSLINQLKKLGYDLKTLKFTIKKT